MQASWGRVSHLSLRIRGGSSATTGSSFSCVDIAVCWCAVIDGQPPTKLHVGQREETRGKRRGVVLALSVSSE